MLTGKTPFFASTLDQRFSFSLYVPTCHSFSGPPLPLLVIVHGNRRQTDKYLDKVKDLCERHRLILLCPLFPAGIPDPHDVTNYHSVLYKRIRFDTILLSMIEQAGQIWRLRTDKFFLHGFSGGGQFAHRFAYLHPERIVALSVGAPGRITLPDTNIQWPAGLGNLSVKFGVSDRPDFNRMTRIPIQFIVGEKDVDRSQVELLRKADDIEGEGKDRVENIRTLQKAWKAVGIPSDLTVVPNVGHDGMKCWPHVQEWLEEHLPIEVM
ncbi:hypothetical protein V5O48_011170 [Marasmius crinis-equi]|uniref:Uncharacterized protein n=1 Tax=Marasmius crinis-equi TaxID=585013 RepID=A0ABR3F6E6_9AGAR